ncbi:hypothetical protein K0B03_00020 [Patescibacteria group bacterium]|nr:hypothetical protein [Patescibacteria group bacterium]
MKIISKILQKIDIDFSQKEAKKNGFSLIEIIFSIGILTITIVSVISLLIFNLKTEITNKNKVIAIYLAQEGIEIVREVRDNNWLAGDDWLNGISEDGKTPLISDKASPNSGWTISENSGYEKKIYMNIAQQYYIQSGENLAGDDNFVETGYQRRLNIRKGSGKGSECKDGYCIKVKSIVSYNEVVIAEVTAYLYQWSL